MLFFWNLYMEVIITICNSIFYCLLQHEEHVFVFNTFSSYMAIFQLEISSIQAQYITTTVYP